MVNDKADTAISIFEELTETLKQSEALRIKLNLIIKDLSKSDIEYFEYNCNIKVSDIL